MHIYAAAVYTNKVMPGQNFYNKMTPVEQEVCRTVPHILESWHYVNKDRFVNQMRAAGAKVFLDSGAFSAFTLGVELSVADYCAYIQKNIDILRVEDGDLMVSVMDAIGDEHKTWANQLAMEQLGVRPMPTFHSGEDERYLEYYAANYGYMSLGGMVGQSVKQLERWLDRVWDKYLVDGAGRPKTKVHGFGITAIDLMHKYPWYSCDSSSWVQAASFGALMTAHFGNLQVSSTSPDRHVWGAHISTLSDIERAVVEKYLEDRGFNYERLSKEYVSRFAFNLLAYREINAMVDEEQRGQLTARIQELF